MYKLKTWCKIHTSDIISRWYLGRHVWNGIKSRGVVRHAVKKWQERRQSSWGDIIATFCATHHCGKQVHGWLVAGLPGEGTHPNNIRQPCDGLRQLLTTMTKRVCTWVKRLASESSACKHAGQEKHWTSYAGIIRGAWIILTMFLCFVA